MKRYNIYTFVWDTCELFYAMTGLRLQVPIEYFYPEFCAWLFGKMTGLKGKKK